jgi:serine phosphatase RsbU (regulator of sigma subunit)
MNVIIICGFLLYTIAYFRELTSRQNNELESNYKSIGIQKQLVELKNREITDSIEYALRIQNAILPPAGFIEQSLGSSFIYYKPKDIVAGDFYWIEKINDTVLFAACDCTGHGVPGAMVSVICHNALNRAVREFGLKQPAEILDKTAELVIENFCKSEEDIKDGMDISLCAYNTSTKTLQWAGANNPLWLIKNGELIETKPDKQPIGMSDSRRPFTNHTFNVSTSDTIYLFSDGVTDQFGGETGNKKLTKKRFREFILSIQGKEIEEQGTSLEKFISDYRKKIEQIDDMLVIGLKIQGN